MDIDGVDIFGIACLLFIFSYLIYILYYAIGLYELNPFLRPKPLSTKEIHQLKNSIDFLHQLEETELQLFYERTAWFKYKKTFAYRKGVRKKQEVELLISAAAVALTLGMKNFKYIRSVQRIVIYPSDYFSLLNRRHHAGEYNPRLRTAVFSADSVQSGFENTKDNVNLAIHEMAHALCFETRRKNTWEARKFQAGLRKMREQLQDSDFQKRIKDSDYFREYGYSNLFEFFAVATENFLETPKEFKGNFPELYELTKTMLNFDFSDPKSFPRK
ncbi:zinc-dependent peptidase [Flagellimonas allohymeniacidonis]|uniref:zinc-dependent peptidase n=1 Tax=Flagellimonas allohymeniacidonis TaxID=2517819 RepID=UPI0013EEC863|nr:zinc-dependent peptidase [Allomuricauda hymeniacidonis]